ncbi:Dynamin [Penicillium malachiteum]|uniref:Dynamin n=1 Tax=Penicillium malachiteum TaxID=1324776 RepID=UPI0025486C18|nr:Dynamin [Penicillium malachiteum]KAJ5714861.1 Dynamin [Penicillium malachiteum]
MPKYGPVKITNNTIMDEAHDATLAEVALADPILLGKIDKLFACNVGEYISLPQLVAVGDQSSGKSSVLEGLTGLIFPRDSGLCTQFATQIIFRRMKNLDRREISASIIPDLSVMPEQEHKLRAWSASGTHTMTASGFSKMMQEVHDLMGLSTRSGDSEPTFSNSVPRLEICGPDEDHLSVIDVPGIFKNTTMGSTTKADMVLEIIEMAHELDPTGARTLGIMTKPDLVDKGAEDKVIDLIENGSTTGQLGRVSSDNYGISTLRARLKELLTSNVRRVFPEVRVELSKKLKEATKALDALGIERHSAEQQRRILLDIVADFQSITRHALSTDYGSTDIFNNEELRLATMISTRNSRFSKDMAIRGHEYNFVSGNVDSEDEQQKQSKENGKLILSYDATIFKSDASRKLPDFPDIQEILESPKLVPAPRSFGIHTWTDQVYSSSRGFEIGTFNPTIVSTLFKQQTAKWPSIGMGYISDIIIILHQFIVRILDTICVDKGIAASIISLIMDELTDRYRLAQERVKFLLTVEREGTLMTMNHYLNDNLQRCCQNRLCAAMALLTLQDSKYGEVAADYYLITGPQTPINLLSPTWVNDLSSNKLRGIAGENANILRKRHQLRKQIEDLEAGKKVLAS